MSEEIGIEDMVYCEGCQALLHPDFVKYDVEMVPLCDECDEIAPQVRWDGTDWVEVTA